jgi:hypothetical protein
MLTGASQALEQFGGKGQNGSAFRSSYGWG